MSATRNNSTSSVSSTTSSLQQPQQQHRNIFQKLGHAIKEHNREMADAYEAYYGAPRRPSQRTLATPPATPRGSVSVAAEDVAPQQQQERRKSSWQRVKEAAKEEHESVNAAHRALYG